MPALVAGIHVFQAGSQSKDMDGRDKPGHDGGARCASQVRLKAALLPHSEHGGWVYILTNKPNGTLYIGVTANLARRVYQHRTGETKGFTSRYGLKLLVWYEHFPDIRDAIQRETSMKRWPRAWKVRTLMMSNPDWVDLYETLA